MTAIRILALLALIQGLIPLFFFMAKALGKNRSARTQLRLHYQLLATLIAIGLGAGALSAFSFPIEKWIPVPAVATIWSSSEPRSFSADEKKSQREQPLLKTRLKTLPLNNATEVLMGSILLWLLGVAFLSIKDGIQLATFARSGLPLKRWGQVKLLIDDSVTVPCSFWLPGNAFVLLPTAIASVPHSLRMAVAHELQHHRQYDTVWAHITTLGKRLFFFNPFLRQWIEKLMEVQEFACDETLVDRKRVESQQYIRCLIETAQTVLRQPDRFVRAPRMTGLVEASLLKRRIEAMLSPTKPYHRIPVAVPVILFVFFCALSSLATQTLVQDRRLSFGEVEKLVKATQSRSQFPLTMNSRVHRQLNRFVGTIEGRTRMREAMERMKAYQPLISKKLEAYQVPAELAAIPLIESGYRNLPPNNRAGWGAGLWMFLKQTAIRYGLKVDRKVDERLDVERLTDAAMRLLKADYYRFQDWQLSVLAYNAGENGVQKGIDSLKTRDPWTLIEQGFENDQDYLAEVIAAILIMKNPELIS